MYRKTLKALTGGSVFVLFLVLAACRPESDPALPPVADVGTVLVHNARIYTGNAGFSLIENGAMAFTAEGEIITLGDNEPMLGSFPGAHRVDLEGKLILPGLIDAHGHLSGLALSYTRANLVGTKSKSEAIERLRDFEETLAKDAWLLGQGWDQNDWPEQEFPTRQDLDTEFPDRPVWLQRIDGHAAWGNSVAIAQADRNLSGAWQPEGGAILRDKEGQATGLFIDGAMSLVDSAVPDISPDVLSSALDQAILTLSSLGLTGVHDAGIDRVTVELYLEKISRGIFPLRVYAMADGMNETLAWLCESGPINDPSGRLVMRSVKLHGDGALGSRGAALLADYSDDPGNTGLLFAPRQQVETNMRRVMACGLQIGIHAIGDAGNRQALDAFETVIPEFPDNPGRHRVEHAQTLHPRDIPRFAQLGIIAAMQPTHATSDMYWAENRLDQERVRGAYAWRSLLGSGAMLAFGSDFPVEEVNPMHGIYAAVTRQDMQGWPEGGWYPEQKVSREEAIRAFTLDAAFAGFMEQQTGSLEPGKRADFIVLDRDILTVPEEEIYQVVVEQTWLDGKRIYMRE